MKYLEKRCVHISAQRELYTGIVLVYGTSFELLELHSIIRSQVLWFVGSVDCAGRCKIYGFKYATKTQQVYYGNKVTECVCPLVLDEFTLLRFFCFTF